MKFKGFIRRAKRRVSLLIVILVMMTTLTGCGIDNTMINSAVINSVLAKDIFGKIQEQVSLIINLKERHIIPDVMADGLLRELGEVIKGIEQLNGGSINYSSNSTNSEVQITEPDEDSDDNATAANILSDGGKHEFIERVIASIDRFGSYPKGKTPVEVDSTTISNRQLKQANEYSKQYGSFINVYQGFVTENLIEQSDYSGAYNQGNARPLEVFGSTEKHSSDDKLPTSIKGLVDYLNGLRDMDVYYINPAHVDTTAKLASVKEDIQKAMGGDETALNKLVAGGVFAKAGDNINISANPISQSSIYSVQTVGVPDVRKNDEGTGWETVPNAVTYKIKLLNKSAIENAFKVGEQELDLSSGVRIGNVFLITRYPLAVFRGVVQDPSDSSKYLPTFYSTDFNATYTSTKGSSFSGSAGALTENYDTNGGRGTASSKYAYVDIFTGEMYYKDGTKNAANSFMGIGSQELEASFVVKPATSVYKVKDNETLITTVSHTGGVAYEPTDKVNIGVTTVEVNKSKVGTMPVFFLTDYLELIYSPETVGNDAFTAYGRKVRLDESVMLGSSALTAETGSIAYIVGEGATTSGWSNKASAYKGIGIEDLMDIDGFYTYDGTTSSLTAKDKTEGTSAEQASSVVRLIKAGQQFEAAGTIHSGDVTAERSDMLPQIAAQKSIECVLRFGASGLDEADSGVSKKTPLYGILVRGNVYDRQLLTEWILASGNANLIKWEKTITDLGYPSYKISNALLDEKLKGNYAFELNQDGLLTLDLDTILDINKENQEERRGGALVYLRTLLMVLGFGLIAYVSVLIGAWVADVNLDLGLNFLHKVSIGHFVAVRSLDEMPEADPESKTTYVDFRKLLFRCFVFAAVGIIILTVDPVNLVVKIMSALSFVINFLSEKLFGVKVF